MPASDEAALHVLEQNSAKPQPAVRDILDSSGYGAENHVSYRNVPKRIVLSFCKPDWMVLEAACITCDRSA